MGGSQIVIGSANQLGKLPYFSDMPVAEGSI